MKHDSTTQSPIDKWGCNHQHTKRQVTSTTANHLAVSTTKTATQNYNARRTQTPKVQAIIYNYNSNITAANTNNIKPEKTTILSTAIIPNEGHSESRMEWKLNRICILASGDLFVWNMFVCFKVIFDSFVQIITCKSVLIFLSRVKR